MSPQAREGTILNKGRGGGGDHDGPMLALLQNLLRLHLRRTRQEAAVRVEEVALDPGGLRLKLAFTGGNMPGGLPALKGGLNLLLEIEDTTPKETRFRYHLEGGASGKLANLALRNLPPGWINSLLQPLVGDALRLEGALLVLNHQSLLQPLLLRK